MQSIFFVKKRKKICNHCQVVAYNKNPLFYTKSRAFDIEYKSHAIRTYIFYDQNQLKSICLINFIDRIRNIFTIEYRNKHL